MAQNSFEVRTAIRKYVQALEDNGIRVEQVLLYGSHAKNAAHPDSDIDIIIVSENFIGKHLIEPIEAYGFTPEEVQKRDLSAFWEEILETEAIAITDEILAQR